MSKLMKKSLLLIGMLLGACATPAAPTLTPTRSVSGPTLAPSPTAVVLSSDDLYDDDDFVGQSNPTVAAFPVDGVLPPVSASTPDANNANSVTVVLEDGMMLVGDLYENEDGNRQPGLLLIGADRTAWGIFPQELQNAGFTVLVMELRPLPVAEDVATMLTALSELGTVDPARIGVIGASAGADLTLLGCTRNLLCDATILLSPLGQDTLLNVIASYNPRALMVVAAQNDAESYPTAFSLLQASTGDKSFLETADGHGVAMLQFDPSLKDEMIRWLIQTLRNG